MTSQFIRKASFVVANSAQALDLAALRFTFDIRQNDTQSPNTGIFRIFNPSPDTISRVQKEFDRVVLQAGYEGGAFGTIFDGTIKQFRRGKLSPVETFLDILAADTDLGLNFAFISKTLAAGASPNDAVNALGKAFETQGAKLGYVGPLIGGVYPRGKVLFGLARDRARQIAASTLTRFSGQAGQIDFVGKDEILPGPPVVLTSRTGLIGMPEATVEGVKIKCLLNPDIRVGRKVQIDNKSINTTTIRDRTFFPTYNSFATIASVTDDGFYRVLVVEHEGDSRGNDWYSNLTCLAVDESAP